MRQPVRPNPGKTPRSLTEQMPFPVKGWTSQNSPVDAEEGTALILDNIFPEAEGGRLRRGFASYATGMVGEVQTLMTHTSASATKQFAAANSAIYDISSAGAVGAAAVSGLTNNKWQHVNFATAATQYLVIANGADAVRNYDVAGGWTTPAITVATPSTLVHVTSHKERLWFTQINSTDLWYLGTKAVAGAATKFGVGALLKRGGYVMACGTWSVDSGSGMDDLFVVYTSEGEVIVYQGTDPASANTWALVGVYETGDPLGRRCMLSVGGDLALLTEDGIMPISVLIKVDRAVASSKALTARIRQAFADATQRSRSQFGWQFIAHPIRNMAVLNVPASGAEATYQYVFNTITGAWARFTGMSAFCWGHYDSDLYFGATGGIVYKADSGGTDNTAQISGAVLPAYTHLKARGRLKHVKMVQPIYSSDIIADSPAVSIAVDYELPTTGATATPSTEGYFTWDVSEWDGPDIWYGFTVLSDWRGSGNLGSVISPYTTVALDVDSGAEDFKYRLTGWGLVYEIGGVL
jgi:hypothetical protein